VPINIFYKFIFCLTITLFFSTNAHAVESVQESKELKSPITNFNISIESKTEKSVVDYSVNQHNEDIDNDENGQANINLVSNENIENTNDTNNSLNTTYEDMNNSREKYSINNLKNIPNENYSEKIIGIDDRIKVDNVFENPYKKIVMLEVK
jgi:hypothetical protein